MPRSAAFERPMHDKAVANRISPVICPGVTRSLFATKSLANFLADLTVSPIPGPAYKFHWRGDRGISPRPLPNSQPFRSETIARRRARQNATLRWTATIVRGSSSRPRIEVTVISPQHAAQKRRLARQETARHANFKLPFVRMQDVPLPPLGNVFAPRTDRRIGGEVDLRPEPLKPMFRPTTTDNWCACASVMS